MSQAATSTQFLGGVFRLIFYFWGGKLKILKQSLNVCRIILSILDSSKGVLCNAILLAVSLQYTVPLRRHATVGRQARVAIAANDTTMLYVIAIEAFFFTLFVTCHMLQPEVLDYDHCRRRLT